jgi:para-aminobenzoate synthetase component 1
MIVEEIPNPPPPEALARALRDRHGFFHLDSSRPEEDSGRAFSYLGFEPFLTWRAKGDQITVETGGTRETVRAEPLAHLRGLMGRHRGAAADTGDIQWGGGAVGFFGHEFGARAAGVEPSAPDEPELPDAQFGLHDGFIACDRTAGKTYLVANPAAGREAGGILARLREAVGEAEGRRDVGRNRRRVGDNVPHLKERAEPVSNMTRADYLGRVARIKDYLAAGDIYQVNLAQRFEATTAEHPLAIYERLRALSPAPFGAYLELGGWQILSSSPELFLRVDAAGGARTRPIKGTRPRGRSPAEDQDLAAELVASAKDQAELLMIVDLERNDLGRVCRTGSVRVEERQRLETHPTVFHLVATVSGRLAPEHDLYDALRSMLPGGSISGVPKIRALQIIAELEPCRRQVYTGALGWLGFDGTCALNVAIRTLVCHGGRARYQVGGGIVADSDPAGEFEETLAKGRAMREAVRGEEPA